MRNDSIYVSLVSPVYNSEHNIEMFVEQSVSTLEKISNDYEIILVNDASTDKTIHALTELGKRFRRLKVINLESNVGQHIASSIALKNASGDYVFTMDSDMQVKPSAMLKLYELSQNIDDWDVISGARITRSNNPIRRIGSITVSYLINKICRTDLKDIGSTFKLIKKSNVKKILSHDFLMQNLPLLIAFMNLRLVEVAIEYDTLSDESGYDFSSLVTALVLAFLNFTNGKNSTTFFSVTGFVCVLFSGFFITLQVIMGVILQKSLATNLLIFFMGIGMFGSILLMLGVIAFKLERINKNLEFRKKVNEYADRK